MKEVHGEGKRNLAVVFYDYQKAYDITGKVVMVLRKLKETWKTRLKVSDCGKVTMSR